MGKHYSIEFKEEVVKVYNSGQYGGYPSVAKKYDINLFTLSNWIKKEKIQGNQENDVLRKRGRPNDENIDYKERYEILKKYQAFLKAQREKK